MTATFWLGAPEPAWAHRTTVPLMVSHNRLRQRKHLDPSTAPTWIDSGVFGDLVIAGRTPDPPAVYAKALDRYSDAMGLVQWASPQDVMCEDVALERTGGTVADHQRLTVDNLVQLRTLGPVVAIVPVLQGRTTDDYLRCADLYDAAGINLETEPRVGVGSICRRHDTTETAHLLRRLHALGFRLHAFGLKTDAWQRTHHLLASADSQAALYAARRQKVRLSTCTHRGPCSYCLAYALQWRRKHLAATDYEVPTLWEATP